MGLTHVTVALKGFGVSNGTYEADFLVDTGATDCLAPAAKLRQIGGQPVGTMAYELADGTTHDYPFGLVEIRFMGEITGGRVIFGPDDAEPLLGVTALESVGITIDPASRTLKRLPANSAQGCVRVPLTAYCLLPLGYPDKVLPFLLGHIAGFAVELIEVGILNPASNQT